MQGLLADFEDRLGPACQQFLAGLAYAAAVPPGGVSITSVTQARRRALQAGGGGGGGGGVRVQYRVSAEEELAAVLASNFTTALATAVNAAGSTLAAVAAGQFERAEVSTAVTFALTELEGINAGPIAVDQARLQVSLLVSNTWAAASL